MEYCYRLASLIDGEGCFAIRRRNVLKATPTWSCLFIVRIRADDEPFLRRMRDGLGLGAIYTSNTLPTPGRANKPAVQWQIATKDGCLELVALLERFPLWSKKARDFEIWARAVRYWATPRTSPRSGRGVQAVIDWTPMEALALELRETRVYREAPSQLARGAA